MNETHLSCEMASFEVLRTETGMPLSLSDNDFSFIPDPGADGNTEHEKIDVNGISPDLRSVDSSADFHLRVADLLEQNRSMKDSLKKNNKMMEEQLSTISAWHQQMISSKAQLQDRLKRELESKSELEKELSELKEKIELLSNQEAAENKICSQCEELKALTVTLEAEKGNLTTEKEKLMQELKLEKQFRRQLEQNVMEVSNYLESFQLNSKLLKAEKRELTALNNTLQLKLSTFDSDFETLIKTDEESGYEIVEKKEKKDDAMKQSLIQLSESQDTILEYTKELEQKDFEINTLRNVCKELSQKLSSSELREKEYLSKSSATQSVENPEQHFLKTFENEVRCHKLANEVSFFQNEMLEQKKADNLVIVKLQEELKKLEEILNVSRQECKMERLKLGELRRNYDQLEADYERVKKLLEIQTKDEECRLKNLDEYQEHQIKSYLEQIDKLTAQLVDKELNLEENMERICQLSSELKTVKEDAEIIPVLKSQVEVYKSDLQNSLIAVAEANEKIEKLKDEVKSLQARVSSVDNGERSSASPDRKPKVKGKVVRTDGKKPSVESNLTLCPVCNFGFSSLQVLENHVHRCLDKASS